MNREGRRRNLQQSERERKRERVREKGREEPAAEEERGSFLTPSSCQDFQLSCTLPPPPIGLLPLHIANTDSHTRHGAPADGLIYAHQACGAALKTSQTHSAIHGANFNSQLCKSCHEIQECFCLSAPLCRLVMPSSSVTLSPLAALFFLLWALCGSCCSL